MKNILLLALGLSSTLLYGQDRITGKSFTTRSEVIAQQGMAATSQPLATQAALDILKQGGTAIDAAIAANAVLGVVEPMSNGIGGDLFAIVWDAKTKKLYGLNASGRSPKALSLAMLKEQNLEKIPTHGPLSLSIPGCVDGWFELHKKFGSLSIKEVLKPAIHYATEGFPVSEVIASMWKESVPYIKDQPGFAETFLIKGKAPKKGDLFKNSALASTLQIIADQGRDHFYKGDIARRLSSFIKKHGGYLTFDDFATHTSEWVTPVSTNYRGYDVWELPPNTQGIAALQMLNILEHYDLRSMGFGSSEYLHLLIEAKKLAYEDRAKFYADPQFNKLPVKELISKEYAKKRNALIDPHKAAKAYDAGALERGNTVYLTTADREGNMVSLIQSVYWEFGSGMTPPDLGFSLQNRGELFSLEKEHYNVYEPGKRPFHTIIPGFVTKKGKPFISFGVMGGSMQPQGHVQVLVNMIDFDMNLQEAGDAPRIRHSGSSNPMNRTMTNGGTVNMETGFDPEVVRELAKRGHAIKHCVGHYGGYQAILYDQKQKVYYGASESRKDGHAAGY